MLKVSVGHSCDPDAESAIQEAIEISLDGLSGNAPQAGILLAAPDYEHGILLDSLDKAFPALELIGGTTNSELSSQEGFQQDSLVLVLFSSDTIEIRAGVGHQAGQASEAAVKQAIESASETLTQPIKLCLALPDGLTANCSRVVDSLRATLPPNTAISGGATGEGFKYDKTHQFFKTKVLTDTVPVLLFSGDLKLSFGVSSGWQTIGSQGTVTRSSGNTVYEIDHQPARQFYSNYFGELTLVPGDNGLAVFEENEEKFYFRSLQQQYDTQATALTFLGDVPQQSTVQLAQADRKDLLHGSKTSILDALATYPGSQPSALLCFSCAGRRMLLGKEAHKEYEEIQAALPNPLPISGFYAYGEIAPFAQGKKAHLHNYTLVSLLLGTE